MTARILVAHLSKPADPLEWRKGPPPFVGWWNAGRTCDAHYWRWWNGKQWSIPARDTESAKTAAHSACTATMRSEPILYRTYYPANARVPRMAP